MKTILKIVSFIGLILTVVPSILVFNDSITLDMHKWLMLLGAILWFVTAPFWMNKKATE
jgi:hypothetical protein